MYHRIHCSNSSPILELSVKFASQICHENIIKPLDGAYSADSGITIKLDLTSVNQSPNSFSGNYVLAGFSDKLRLMNLLIDDIKTFRELQCFEYIRHITNSFRPPWR